MEDDFEFEESRIDEAFHIETDLYETGDYSNLLVIPCNDTFNRDFRKRTFVYAGAYL